MAISANALEGLTAYAKEQLYDLIYYVESTPFIHMRVPRTPKLKLSPLILRGETNPGSDTRKILDYIKYLKIMAVETLSPREAEEVIDKIDDILDDIKDSIDGEAIDARIRDWENESAEHPIEDQR